jgi:hypothetical protein
MVMKSAEDRQHCSCYWETTSHSKALAAMRWELPGAGADHFGGPRELIVM